MVSFMQAMGNSINIRPSKELKDRLVEMDGSSAKLANIAGSSGKDRIY